MNSTEDNNFVETDHSGFEEEDGSVQHNTFSVPTVLIDEFWDHLRDLTAQAVLHSNENVLREKTEEVVGSFDLPDGWSFELSVFTSDELGIDRVTNAAVFLRAEDEEGELVADYSYGAGAADVDIEAPGVKHRADVVLDQTNRN